MRLVILASLAAVLIAADVRSEAFSQIAAAPAAQLVLSGPSSMPLFRKGQGVTFHAVLVNHSNTPLIFVAPHKDWPEQREMEWQAVDAKNRVVKRLPNNAIWCDPGGRMYSEPAEEFYGRLYGNKPREIKESDVVILKPGNRYEFPDLADPSFALSFLRRGEYGVSLNFSFSPEHYELPNGSKYSSELKRAGAVSLRSNEVELAIN